MNNLEQDHPITREWPCWIYAGSRFWFKKNAENERANFLIATLAPESYAHHLRKGTKGYVS